MSPVQKVVNFLALSQADFAYLTESPAKKSRNFIRGN